MENKTATYDSLAAVFEARGVDNNIIISYSDIGKIAAGLSSPKNMLHMPMVTIDHERKCYILTVISEADNKQYSFSLKSRCGCFAYMSEINDKPFITYADHYATKVAEAISQSFNSDIGMRRAIHHYNSIVNMLTDSIMPTHKFPAPLATSYKQYLTSDMAYGNVKVIPGEGGDVSEQSLRVLRNEVIKPVTALTYQTLALYLQRLSNSLELSELHKETPSPIFNVKFSDADGVFNSETVFHAGGVLLSREIALSVTSGIKEAIEMHRNYVASACENRPYVS